MASATGVTGIFTSVTQVMSTVTPPGLADHTIDLKALVDEVRQRGVGLPLLLPLFGHFAQPHRRTQSGLPTGRLRSMAIKDSIVVCIPLR